MNVERVEYVDTAITIEGISIDMAEKIFAFLGVVESRHNDEIDILYHKLQTALGKAKYGRSKYKIGYDDSCIPLSLRGKNE